MIAVLALPLALLTLQQGISDRLAGRVSPEIAALVSELGSAAAARGLPIDPLIQKAIEGSAKGVPSDRVATAVRLVAAQLDTAAAGLRDGGSTGDTVAIAAGAFAITAGLTGRDIAELARSGSRPSELIVGLRVAGTLTALGVPRAETVALVSATLQGGRPVADLLALPGQVQAQVARGTTPAQAAAGLARAAAAQARRGPPPSRPQPPPHPVPPPQP
ncbi:MAG: hypothetical protein ACREMI_04065 [Gemmatimonadales bacterium]